MSAAAAAAQAVLDEVRHMRRYSRFGAVPDRLRDDEDESFPGPEPGEGNRLLMGQWQFTEEVRLHLND